MLHGIGRSGTGRIGRRRGTVSSMLLAGTWTGGPRGTDSNPGNAGRRKDGYKSRSHRSRDRRSHSRQSGSGSDRRRERN